LERGWDERDFEELELFARARDKRHSLAGHQGVGLEEVNVVVADVVLVRAAAGVRTPARDRVVGRVGYGVTRGAVAMRGKQ
jgi:hypothetical protein